MTKKNIDFRCSEWIEESASDEVQTVLDKADSTPPVVENPDSLDLDVGCKTNTVGQGKGNNDNHEELLDTIYMSHMRVLDIELAGFQAFEHGLGSPSFLLGRECFFRSAERNEVLRLRLSGLVFDNVSGQIAEFTTDTVYTMQDAFFPVFEIGETY
ncbi:MAG: hypothetical protein PUK70_07930 [Bacteroidales bacterium]|nr:hypothetical protein [Bacteroidales bacterium]MDY6002463.1 hypothetical protein [Candidatus Cryptobacteroides sp.]